MPQSTWYEQYSTVWNKTQKTSLTSKIWKIHIFALGQISLFHFQWYYMSSHIAPVVPCCSVCHHFRVLFNKAWTQVLCRFKSCLRRVEDLPWWGSLTMVLTGNKAKRFFLVNHTMKTINYDPWILFTFPVNPYF